MFKVRYAIATIWIYYILYAFVSLIIEDYILKGVVAEIQRDMRIAGDMALQQTQFMDDFLTFRPDTAYELLMPTQNQGTYNKESVFKAMWGIDVQSEDDLDTVYNKVYANEELGHVLGLTADSMKVGLRWYDQDINSMTTRFPTMSWYAIPRGLTLGSDFVKGLGGAQALFDTSNFDSLEGQGTDSGKRDKLLDGYGLTEVVRESGDKKYFNTPLNTGITYVNRDLVSSLFINNMDLLMRQKYQGETSNEFSNGLCADADFNRGLIHSETVNCGLVLSDKIEGESLLKNAHPINNGEYTLLRYDRIENGTQGKLYEGVKTKIEYKVVDMHDNANNTLLRAVFGNRTHTNSNLGLDKASYFRNINNDKRVSYSSVLNPLYDQYPFVLAKVTFYADVIIPYTTPLMRELAVDFEGAGALGKFLEVRPQAGTNVNDNGVRRFEYTVYFAVAP